MDSMIGHNSFATLNTARIDQLVAASDEWMKLPSIQDEATAKALDDQLKILEAERKATDTARKAEKKPHDDAAAAVQARYNPWLARLDAAINLLKPKRQAWLRLVEDRLQAERRAKEAAARKAIEDAENAAIAARTINEKVEAELKAKAASDQVAEAARPVKAQVQGDLAQRATGLRQYWSAEITDWQSAAISLCRDLTVRDAIQSAANKLAREQHEALNIAGIRAKMELR